MGSQSIATGCTRGGDGGKSKLDCYQIIAKEGSSH